MSLPRPPISLNTPIPNQPFSADEVYYLEGNQGRLPLGNGLYIDPATGTFTDIEPSPYIYCVPQYGNLPVSYPPYGCETEVNTAGVTDFTDAWYRCEEITEFPCVDSGSVTDFSEAWSYCYGITSFPSIDTGAGENFYYSWAYTGLTSFPKLNTSNGLSFRGTWCGCYYMTEFPNLDLGKGEDFTYAWGYCEELSSFSTLDASSGTNFGNAWYNCTSLTSFPLLNVSSGTNFGGAWYNCNSLTSFPLLDVSSGTNFGGAWQSCNSLTSFPLLDVSSGTYFNNAWADCTNLTTFSAGMFDSCQAIQFDYAWTNCALSQQSVDNILISLDTAGQNNGTVGIDSGTSSTPGTAGWAAVLSLQGKGWTVSVNGLPPGMNPAAELAETALESVTQDLTTPQASEIQFPQDPEPDQEFTDVATNKRYKWQRARLKNGWFRADDPSTPENEAWAWQWLPLDINTEEAK